MPKSKDFEEKEKLIKLQHKHDLDKHQLKMKELEFTRESNRLYHERELERGRIKSAEIRKAQMRRQDAFRH